MVVVEELCSEHQLFLYITLGTVLSQQARQSLHFFSPPPSAGQNQSVPSCPAGQNSLGQLHTSATGSYVRNS